MVPGVTVYLHQKKVKDIEERDGRFFLITDDSNLGPIPADHVLFLTGHSSNHPQPGSLEAELKNFSDKQTKVQYVPYAYPLEINIRSEMTGSDKIVGCVGLGLTAIDVILYLTEGRGGRFTTDLSTNSLIYIPSGREPKRIIGISRSGIFTTARPYNAKESNPAKLEHKGIFLTEKTIDLLRQVVGVPVELDKIGIRQQLDFERHLLPVILLEMMYLYYKTLFGQDFSEIFVKAVSHRFSTFISRKLVVHEDLVQGVDYLCTSARAVADIALAAVDSFLQGVSLALLEKRYPALNINNLIRTYFGVVLGLNFLAEAEPYWNQSEQVRAIAKQWISPWQHPLDPYAHVFDWERMITPINRDSYEGAEEYNLEVIRYMEYDHLQAAQGNLRNPTKAACDGIWRDLRTVIAYAIDFGGLTANSHRIFLEKYLPYHNRLANGACLAAMEKMLALIKAEILDISTGPRPKLSVDVKQSCFQITGSETGANYLVDTLIDAKLHKTYLHRDTSLLYTNLLKRGFIRIWCNRSADGSVYEPGGIEVTRNFQAVSPEGFVNTRMTFLGSPTEGVMFFQIGAARPQQNHHVLNDVIHWVKGIQEQLREHGACTLAR